MEDYYAAMVVGWCDGWMPAVVVGHRWFEFSMCLAITRSLSSVASRPWLDVVVWVFGGTDEASKRELGCVGCGGWVSRRDG